MSEFIIKLFIKNPEDTANPRVREAYGLLAGVVGIIANLLLCSAKFFVGMLSGSIAIQADAVNNLSDMGSSVVTLIGFRVASKPADSEHPYGHARLEYIVALITAFLILLAGFELGKESVRKIFSPEPVDFSIATMVVLVLSIGIKLWMSRFSANIGRRIGSGALSAAAADSLYDIIATGAILLSTIVGYFGGINIDGYIGVLVAAFVLFAGISILKDTISPLMGEASDPEMVEKLCRRLLSYEGIINLHDIMLHNYGPGRVIASAHAEVRSDSDIVKIHEVLDTAEREVAEEMGILLTLHLDPVDVDNPALNAARELVSEAVANADERLMFHDLRIVPGETRKNLVFDIVVPPGMAQAQIVKAKNEIQRYVSSRNSDYLCVIEVDRDYIGATAGQR